MGAQHVERCLVATEQVIGIAESAAFVSAEVPCIFVEVMRKEIKMSPRLFDEASLAPIEPEILHLKLHVGRGWPAHFHLRSALMNRIGHAVVEIREQPPTVLALREVVVPFRFYTTLILHLPPGRGVTSVLDLICDISGSKRGGFIKALLQWCPPSFQWNRHELRPIVEALQKRLPLQLRDSSAEATSGIILVEKSQVSCTRLVLALRKWWLTIPGLCQGRSKFQKTSCGEKATLDHPSLK